MKKALNSILISTCIASLAFAMPAYAETTQIGIDDNKNTQFSVEFVSHIGNTWTYQVSHLNGRDLSHWGLVIPCLDTNGVSSNGEGFEAGADGSIQDRDIFGVKWNSKGGTFSFTLDEDYPEGQIEALVKAGNGYATGMITGPSCNGGGSGDICEEKVYAVHDGGLNNSQFFTIDPADGYAIAALGPEYPLHDIEALDIHPTTDVLYAASGDDTAKQGHLYTVNKSTGVLTDLGATDKREIDALSFHPDGTLWGWAQDEGLFMIVDPASSLDTEMMYIHASEVEDITWSLDGSILYAIENNTDGDPDGPGADAGLILWKYDLAADTLTSICADLLAGATEVEALETLPDDSLAFGMHGQTSVIVGAINPTTCKVVAAQEIATNYDDIEGIAWPDCSDNEE